MLLLGLQLCGEASGVRGAASDTPAGAGLTPPAVTLLSNASVLSGCSGSHCSEGAHPEAPPRVRHSAMDELSVFAAHHGRAVSLFGRGSAGSNFTHDEEDSTQAFFQNSLAPILASSGCFLLLMLVVALARYRLGSPLPAKGKDCFSSAMLPCLIERNSRFSLSIIPDALADVWCPAGKPKVEHAKADDGSLTPEGEAQKKAEAETAFWRTALHFGFCVLGVMSCHIALGFYQERTMTRTFESGNTFEYGAFLTLCNRFATLVLTILALIVVPRSDVLGSAPIHEYSVGAYTNLISSMAQYLSLDYVSFPLLVLSKSCKMPPVMLLGYIVHNKSYKGFEYTSAMLVLMGTFFFLLYDDDKSQRADAAGQTSSSFGGVILLLIYIFSDAFTSNWQASMFEKYGLSIGPMMLWSSVFALLFGVAGSFVSLEVVGACAFIVDNPSIMQDIVVISVFSALGQFFVLYTIRSYGALSFAAIANVRQVVSALISIVYFQHVLNSLQCLGMCTVFLALAAHLRFKWHARATKIAQQKGTGSDASNRWRTAEEAFNVGMVFASCLPRRCAQYMRARTASLQLITVVVLLIGVATIKAIVTKSVLDDVPGIPVAFSAISCTVTVIWILPIFAFFPASFNALRYEMIPSLVAACLLVAIDLTCTNIAIALLSVPLQQCMSALTPVITAIIEACYRCRMLLPWQYLLVLTIAGGMSIMLYGTFSDIERAESASFEQTAVGVAAMSVALLATSTKYVALHAIIRNFRKELGALSFLFWFEVFTMTFVVPWSIADGELGQLVATPSLNSQLMLYGVAALGGVRFLTQLLALRVMSPTSLSVANVGAHLLVAAISFGVLHVYVNTAIVLGFVITLGALLGYVYVVFRQGVGFDETRQGPNCCEVITSWFTQQLHGRRDAQETAVGHPVDDEAALPSEAEEREAKKT